MQAISYFLTAAEKHLLLLIIIIIIIIIITIIVIIIIIIPYTFSILSKFYSPPKQTIRLVSPIEKYCFMVKTIILHPASFETNTFINVCLSRQLNPSCVYKCSNQHGLNIKRQPFISCHLHANEYKILEWFLLHRTQLSCCSDT